jgi:aspartokinase
MYQTRTRRHVCFASVIEGDVTSPSRETCEFELFTRLMHAGIPISMLTLHDGGCAFAVDEYDLNAVRDAMHDLNLALSIRLNCARVTLQQRGERDPHWSPAGVIAAIAQAGIGMVHLSANDDEIAVLVDQREASRVQAAMTETARAHAVAG